MWMLEERIIFFYISKFFPTSLEVEIVLDVLTKIL